MILNKPTNFSNIKYSYPNLNQNRYPNQIIDLTQTYDMDIFFQNNLLLLQSLNKIPIQINLSLLQSLKKKNKKQKTKPHFFPYNDTLTPTLATTTICTITKSLSQRINNTTMKHKMPWRKSENPPLLF